MIKVMNAAGTAKTLQEAKEVLKYSDRVMLGSYLPYHHYGKSGSKPDVFGEFYSLNRRGVPTQGDMEWSEICKELCRIPGKEVWVSIAGRPDDLIEGAEIALAAGASYVELNLSCPNLDIPIVSYYPQKIKECLDFDLTNVGVKLAPILDMGLLYEVTKCLRDVEFVTSTNTVPNCCNTEDFEVKDLMGMSGAAIKPIGLGQIIQLRRFLPEMFLIGVGGIRSKQDAQDYLRAGANMCQVGTEIFKHGPQVLERLND